MEKISRLPLLMRTLFAVKLYNLAIIIHNLI